MDCGKLLELLNEHAHTYADHYDDTGEEIAIDFYKHTDQCFLYTEDGQFESLVDDVVISKRFGFIKRLIENDKIDYEKCGFGSGAFGNWYDKGIAFVQNYDNDTYEVSQFYSPYLQLLMLLAIQDEPIRFLCEILK